MNDQDQKLAPHPELQRYYGRKEERERFVRDIFDETAGWYDSIIAFLSLGSGQWYRRKALERHGLKQGMRLLDVATGTGVVAEAAGRVLNGSREIIGLDPSIGMLLESRRLDRSVVVQGAGETLPFRSAHFDMISMGFALRHLADLRGTFREYRRVLRPGAKVLILEITPPSSKIGFAVLRFYMNRVIPAVALLTTGSRKAKTLMQYYWDTTANCVPPETILQALRDAGFTDVKRHVEVGTFSEYSGVVPEV